MDDKVKIRCPACKQVFREKAHRVRDGVQLNCPNCCKLLTLNRDTDDPYFRRALKRAKDGAHGRLFSLQVRLGGLWWRYGEDAGGDACVGEGGGWRLAEDADGVG